MLFVIVLSGTMVFAAPAGGTVDARVVSGDGAPVAAAAVVLDGPVHRAAATANDGSYRFADLPPGIYRLNVTKPGFAALLRDDVVVGPGAASSIVATLSPSSFSSLGIIGRTATTTRAAINTTPAAIDVIGRSTFLDRGAVQLPRLLNEIPGVLTTVGTSGGINGASAGIPQVPQIRGALPYETASLIDGHPVSVGSSGRFSPLLVNPALLQNVEVVKGPGAFLPEINYAIGGSVNYRTLEPTRTPQRSIDLGVDRYGGVETAVRATGSVLDHRVDYAFAYATLGTPGALLNTPEAGSQLSLAFGNPPWYVNGQALPGSPIRLGPSLDPRYVAPIGSVRFNEPIYVCCSPVNTGYNARSELAKLRFNLSQQTALTVSYLGGQSYRDQTGGQLGSISAGLNFSVFTPPAGYTGSVPAGTQIPFDNQINSDLSDLQRQNLFQAELRSALGATTILARAYAGSSTEEVMNYPVGGSFSYTENAWGGIALCPPGATARGTMCALPGGAIVAPTTTFFNGTPVTFTSSNAGSYGRDQDNVRGASVELDRTFGEVQTALSFDRSVHDSTSFVDAVTTGVNGYQLPPGSSQGFTTVALRLAAPLGSRVNATFADYAIVYGSHYTGDGGKTWQDAVHSFNAPRFGLSWRPSPATAVRFALGASIAPPYIALLSSPGSAPTSNSPGAAQYYLQNQNNGRIRPETAFGYDLGADHRIGRDVTLSVDAYVTNLRDLFLQQTTQVGTYTATTGADNGITAPLFVTSTQNLGHARFEGLELQLQRRPPAGLGYVLSGAFMRAYPYAIPEDFYATASGPYTANLAILPNVNFQPGGTGFNGFTGGRIPYAQGYAELNHRTAAGTRFALGATYYGSNNQFNRPAFAVVSANARLPLGTQRWVQLDADNITSAYADPYADLYAGVPVPLVTGLHGATTGTLGPVYGANVGPASFRLTYHQAFGAR